MEENQIKWIESQIGYTFKNKKLLEQAYTLRSFAQENPWACDNEILEFVGDSVIQRYVTEVEVERFMLCCENGYLHSQFGEGELSKMREKHVRKEHLAMRVERMVLAQQDFFSLGKGDAQNEIYKLEHIKENLAEAIVGAIAIDSHFSSADIKQSLSKIICLSWDAQISDCDAKESLYHVLHLLDVKRRHVQEDGTKSDFSEVCYLQELWRSGWITQPQYFAEEALPQIDGTEWWKMSGRISMALDGARFETSAFGPAKKVAKLNVARQLLACIYKYCRGTVQ